MSFKYFYTNLGFQQAVAFRIDFMQLQCKCLQICKHLPFDASVWDFLLSAQQGSMWNEPNIKPELKNVGIDSQHETEATVYGTVMVQKTNQSKHKQQDTHFLVVLFIYLFILQLKSVIMSVTLWHFQEPLVSGTGSHPLQTFQIGCWLLSYMPIKSDINGNACLHVYKVI